MSKRRRPPQGNKTPPGPPSRGLDAVGLTTLIAVAIVLLVSVLNLRAVERIQDDLDRKLDRVEDKIAKVSEKVGSPAAPAAAPATPPRSGPDPNRAYPIKTADRAAKGPAGAPVTIAEFSDFQ